MMVWVGFLDRLGIRCDIKVQKTYVDQKPLGFLPLRVSRDRNPLYLLATIMAGWKIRYKSIPMIRYYILYIRYLHFKYVIIYIYMYYIFVIRARCTRGAACRFAHSISLIADRQAEKMLFFCVSWWLLFWWESDFSTFSNRGKNINPESERIYC